MCPSYFTVGGDTVPFKKGFVKKVVCVSRSNFYIETFVLKLEFSIAYSYPEKVDIHEEPITKVP